MLLVARSKADQNEAVLDPWSIVHLGAGLASGLVGIPLLPALAAATLYELVERRAETESAFVRALFKTSGPEATSNAVADVILFAVGAHLGRKWNQS